MHRPRLSPRCEKRGSGYSVVIGDMADVPVTGSFCSCSSCSTPSSCCSRRSAGAASQRCRSPCSGGCCCRVRARPVASSRLAPRCQRRVARSRAARQRPATVSINASTPRRSGSRPPATSSFTRSCDARGRRTRLDGATRRAHAGIVLGRLRQVAVHRRACSESPSIAHDLMRGVQARMPVTPPPPCVALLAWYNPLIGGGSRRSRSRTHGTSDRATTRRGRCFRRRGHRCVPSGADHLAVQDRVGEAGRDRVGCSITRSAYACTAVSSCAGTDVCGTHCVNIETMCLPSGASVRSNTLGMRMSMNGKRGRSPATAS